MADGVISVQVDNREVLAVLERLETLTGNLRPVMADIAQALASGTEKQFKDESGPGGKWPDLSDTTKAMREKAGKWPGKMLQVSAAGLAASVQTGFDANSAFIGSNKPYAAMMQFGGTTSPKSMIPGREIPARQYLPFDEEGVLAPETETVVLEILNERLLAALRG